MELHTLKANFLLVSLETSTNSHALINDCFKKKLTMITMDYRKIYLYISLEAKFAEELQIMVNEKREEGYHLHGEVSASYAGEYGRLYAQSMVKYVDGNYAKNL